MEEMGWISHLHENSPDVHGRAGVFHKVVHRREVVQLHSLEGEDGVNVNRGKP